MLLIHISSFEASDIRRCGCPVPKSISKYTVHHDTEDEIEFTVNIERLETGESLTQHHKWTREDVIAAAADTVLLATLLRHGPADAVFSANEQITFQRFETFYESIDLMRF
jgi:hypothetical protein